jgi:hypothetical protein
MAVRSVVVMPHDRARTAKRQAVRVPAQGAG